MNHDIYRQRESISTTWQGTCSLSSCLTSPRFHHPTHRFFPLTWHILLRPAPLAPGTSLGDQRIPYPTRGHGKHINGVAEGKSTSRAFLI